jgi:hypothetical protein
MPATPFLDATTVASPCMESWHGMTGDDRVRFCRSCRLHVYNLSALSRQDAETLLREKEGHICVRFYERADGTVLTRECRGAFDASRKFLAATAAGVVALAGLLLVLAFSLDPERAPARKPTRTTGNVPPWIDFEPARTIHDILYPPPLRCVAGKPAISAVGGSGGPVGGGKSGGTKQP